MLRTTSLVAVSAFLLVAAVGGCSSSKTGSSQTGGAFSSGGSAVGSGGAGGSGAIISPGGGDVGGKAASGGSGGIILPGGGGGAGGASLCLGNTLTCVDEASAKFCNPDTGVEETLECATEAAKDGLISNGCRMDATGAGCTIDDLADADCAAGTTVFANCAPDLTSSELLDIYVDCFHDFQGAREIVSCLGPFIDETEMSVDCAGAEAACLSVEE